MSLESWAALAAVSAVLTSFAWLVLRGRRYLKLRKLRRRFARGAQGQREATGFLQRRGFEVLAEEHEVPGRLEVDGESRDFKVRVDFLVRKGRRVYGVEVKTGSKATDPLYRPTRRQLLEYSHLLEVDGLFLLDMDAHRLMRIRFCSADRRPGKRGIWLVMLVAGFVLGVAATGDCVGHCQEEVIRPLVKVGR